MVVASVVLGGAVASLAAGLPRGLAMSVSRVSAAADPLGPVPGSVGITGFVASTDPGEQGVVANLTVTTAGGTGALTFSYTGLPPYCLSSNLSVLPCAPTEPGTFLVNVTVNDSSGGSAKASLLWAVHPRLDVGPVNLNPPVTDSYQGETITANISGGVDPLQINWTGLPDECTPNGTAYIHCFPGDPHTYLVEATVRDHLGVVASAGALFSVVAPPLVSKLLILPANITLGQSVTFVTLARAGSGLVSYAYSGLPAGCSSVNASFLTCTPTVNGSFNVTVIAFDQYNGASERTTELNVTRPVAAVAALVSFAASPPVVVLGSPTHLISVVLNGAPPWNVTYTGLPGGCTSLSTLNLPCTPNSTGNFTVHLVAVDANGTRVSGTALLSVLAPPTPTTVTVTKQAPGTPFYEALGGGLAAGLLAGAGAAWMIAARRETPSEGEGDPG